MRKGDLQSEALTAFASAPTAARVSLGIAAFLFVDNPRFRLYAADISRAFTQGEYFRQSDRVWVEFPKCIAITKEDWTGGIYLDYKERDAENMEKKIEKIPRPIRPEFELALYKPFYGTRDAPVRWYCRFAQILADNQFFPLESDRCAFARLRGLGENEIGYAPNATRMTTSYTLLHVDDVVFTDTPGDFQDLQRALIVFGHDPRGELVEGKVMIFFGIQINLGPSRIAEFPQHTYYAKIQPLDKKDFLEKGKVIMKPRDIQRRLRGFILGLLMDYADQV